MPNATRLDRQAAAGLSQVGRSQARDAARTCSLVRPASRSGVAAPRSAAARMPGRKPATASSALVPVATRREPVGGCEGGQHVEQLGLAEVAAVPGVGPVALALHLVGLRGEHPHPQPVGQLPGRGPLALRQRVGVGRGGTDVRRPERAHRRREQERTVRASAVGDQQGPVRHQLGLQRRQPVVQDVAVEPGGQLGQVAQHDVGAGVVQLLLGAAPGQHRDAERARGARGPDALDVAADVDGGAPDLTDDCVRAQVEGVEVPQRGGSVLPGDDDAAAPVPPYGVQRGTRAAAPGRVSMSARSRSKPTTSAAGSAMRPGYVRVPVEACTGPCDDEVPPRRARLDLGPGKAAVVFPRTHPVRSACCARRRCAAARRDPRHRLRRRHRARAVAGHGSRGLRRDAGRSPGRVATAAPDLRPVPASTATGPPSRPTSTG